MKKRRSIVCPRCGSNKVVHLMGSDREIENMFYDYSPYQFEEDILENESECLISVYYCPKCDKIVDIC